MQSYDAHWANTMCLLQSSEAVQLMCQLDLAGTKMVLVVGRESGRALLGRGGWTSRLARPGRGFGDVM